MKNNNEKKIIIILLVLIIVMILSFIGLAATNYIKFNFGDTAKGTDNNINSNETITDNNNNNGEAVTDNETYKQLISISLSELMKIYKTRVQNLSAVTEINYGIVDINNDNIPELIIRSGASEAEYEYIFYTYDEKSSSSNDHIVSIGTFSGGHTSLYKMNDNTLLMLYAHMSQEITSYFKLENNWLIRTSHSSKELSPTEEYASGDQLIELVPSTNDSEFNKYK